MKTDTLCQNVYPIPLSRMPDSVSVLPDDIAYLNLFLIIRYKATMANRCGFEQICDPLHGHQSTALVRYSGRK